MYRRLIVGLLSIIAFQLAGPGRAEAFSVRVHIYLANAIHDELARNMTEHGRPVVRLMRPDGSDPVYVELNPRDAQAILSALPYYRGGAIGPDNTVLTAMTDPSHGWMYRPFQQCDALLANVEAHENTLREANGGELSDADDQAVLEERAYALGCFLHGITDNAAHHLVNFFTGETFTLFPADQAHEGTREQSFINVVRHIATETTFEKSLLAYEVARADEPTAPRPGLTDAPLTKETMESALDHKIPTRLVREVYFTRTSDIWRGLARDLVGRKINALRRALDLRELSSEEIDAMGDDIYDASRSDIIDVLTATDRDDSPWDRNELVIEAYVDFLKNDGLAPAEVIVLLPEILRDLTAFYSIVSQQGSHRYEDIARWRILSRRLLTNAFAPREPDPAATVEDLTAGTPDWDCTADACWPSRFDVVAEEKQAELGRVMDGYIASVERLSNRNVKVGLVHAGVAGIREDLSPLRGSIETISDIKFEILFSARVQQIIAEIGPIKDLIASITDLARARLREFVYAQIEHYLALLRQAYEQEILSRLPPEVVEAIGTLREHTREAVENARAAFKKWLLELARARAFEGRQLPDGEAPRFEEGVFDSFLDSVVYMNAYNSVVGTLMDRSIVVPRASGFYRGPVSFDASYQLAYNQLAVCNGADDLDLRDLFYPCGIAAGSMMHAPYASCENRDGNDALEPPIECYDGSAASFAERPSPEACAQAMLDTFLETESATGSYTLAFPPSALDAGERPSCTLAEENLGLYIGDHQGPGHARGDGSGTLDEERSSASGPKGVGCAVTEPTTGRLPLGPIGAFAIALAIVHRRRRR